MKELHSETLVEQDKEGLLSYIKMYEVSGYDSPTEHSLNRYKRSKSQDEAIRQQIAESPSVVEQQIARALISADSKVGLGGF